ncbi:MULTISPECIES: FecR family protein [Pseudomonas]|jgi:transmembrane sensor|uniref:FecR family protein n=1 Tax=Pseudomonas TaxID=286 RepID=UPI00147378D1|nr:MULTISPECIES: FecR family protein [Pseudomonas]MDD0977710.1 FecR family protein [Pseudomonas shahriarae]MDD1133079.1 FecR family protein [Pseudomonas shahriarae]NMY87254.1 FecR family protein [Pseudomonas sp. WS 5411]
MSYPKVDATTRAAVDWLLRLEAGDDDPVLRQAFETWLRANPQHTVAWQRVGSLLQQPIADLQRVEARSPGQLRAVTHALATPDSESRRKVLRGGLALVLFGVSGAAIFDRAQPLSGLWADRHTATSERKTFALADGSRLSLNARSSVDIHFSDSRRLVRLREGQVFVDVAADPRRPFVIATAQGEVQALGTQFMVRQEATGSLTSVQLHSVQVTTLGGSQRRVEAGEAAWFSDVDVRPVPLSVRSRTDWRDGRVDIRDEPLGLLIDALRPYRRGVLRVSEQAAKVRVYGVYPLDDPEQTLESLAQTFPLRISHYGPWLTLIDVR